MIVLQNPSIWIAVIVSFSFVLVSLKILTSVNKRLISQSDKSAAQEELKAHKAETEVSLKEFKDSLAKLSTKIDSFTLSKGFIDDNWS